MIGLAIIGVGWAGRRQAEAVAELQAHEDPLVSQRVRVVMLMDTDSAYLEAEARALDIDDYSTDFAAAIAHPTVDAVSIASPHQFHTEQVLAAVRAGKHTLVEKPMATDVEAAGEMIAAADANGVTLYVAENEVYGDLVAAAVELLPEVGQPIHVSMRSLFLKTSSFGYPGRRSWLLQPEKGGTGPWALNGIHTIAQLRSVLGEVETVYMQEHHSDSFPSKDIEGTMVGLLTMSSGVLVDVVHSIEFAIGTSLVVHGDRGTLTVTPTSVELQGNREYRADHPTDGLSSYAREVLAFADHLEGRRSGPTDGRSERRSLAVVEAGYESAATGMPVNLRERFGDL